MYLITDEIWRFLKICQKFTFWGLFCVSIFFPSSFNDNDSKEFHLHRTENLYFYIITFLRALVRARFQYFERFTNNYILSDSIFHKVFESHDVTFSMRILINFKTPLLNFVFLHYFLYTTHLTSKHRVDKINDGKEIYYL